ncbi:MAG: glycosyltransferase [Bacteroidales bacterium]|nr:glycosyltransferase [Bacteroidales bacterium]
MKIMQIIWSLEGGGKERRLVQLINGLYAHGVLEQTLVSMSSKNDYQGQFESHADYIIVNQGSKLDRCRQLIKIIETKGPDIVHLWDNTPAFALILPYLKCRFKFKYVAGFVTEALPVKKYSIQAFFNRLSFMMADAVVSNSQACLEAKHIVGKKSHVIYNGFDFARFNFPGFDKKVFRKSLDIEEYQFVVTMTARFTSNKDYPMLVDVAEQFKNCKDIVFLAIGKGETMMRIRQLCAEKGINNVRFLGFRSDVEKILLCSDVGVLFTNSIVHAEGISNSILESMAAGLPVIATNGGGTPEIIENGISGFMVEAGDVQSATSILISLYNNESYRKMIGRNAVKRIRDNFTLETMTQYYIDFYYCL